MGDRDLTSSAAENLKKIAEVLAELRDASNRAADALERIEAGSRAKEHTPLVPASEPHQETRAQRKARVILFMLNNDIRSIPTLSELTKVPDRTLWRWDEVRRYCGLEPHAEIEPDRASHWSEVE